jgi:hypothetical protein
VSAALDTTPGRLPSVTVALSVRLLPRPHRDRYRRELAAELHDLPAADHLSYAFRVLARTWALRAALNSSPPTPTGEPTMTKPLRCRLARHDWEQMHNDDGEEYLECARCGAQKDPIHLADFGNTGGAWF